MLRYLKEGDYVKNENVVDKVISFFSPQRGYARLSYRSAIDEIRSNYDAGSFHRSNWHVINQNAQITDRMDRDVVRARARDLERNSDVMNGVIKAFKRNVVGSGFKLKITIPENQELCKELNELWEEWCKAENCDITGTQNFTEILRMAAVRKKVDGGILFVKVFSKGGLLPFKLQIMEVDSLDLTQKAAHSKNNRVVDGIEFDEFSKPVGYWFRQFAPDGFTLLPSKYVEAKNVIFYFTKNRPTQIREISDLTPSVTRVRDITEFMTAVSVKERIAACLSVFVKRVMPTAGTGLGRAGTNGGNLTNYNEKTLAPGMITELNAGDEIQVVNPSGQSSDSAQFIKIQQRLIASGQGLSYEATSRDMSESNYSSARQGIIEDEETYGEEIEQLNNAMDEIYETFVISCVLSGAVIIPDFWSNKNKYFKHEWVKSPKKWIDPLKEANADKIALSTMQKTFAELCAEKGKDWKETLEEIAEINKYGKNVGIDIGGILYGQKK